MKKAEYLYDVFISHAVEDKIAIANDLFKALKARGLRVWYSGTELSAGDRLVESIHKSLDQCRFGVVIISPTYLSKIWALNEFFFLLKREDDGEKIILPVLYDITPEQLAARSTLMANMFAARADKGLEHVTEFLITEMSKQQGFKPRGKAVRNFSVKKWSIATLGIVVMAVTGVLVNNLLHRNPSDAIIKTTIENHIAELQHKADDDMKFRVKEDQATEVSIEKVQKLYADYINVNSYYRNEYTLNTGAELFQSKKKVTALLGPEVENLTPLKNFTFSRFALFMASSEDGQENSYAVLNLEYPGYEIEKEEGTDGDYTVHVRYTNNIRQIYTNLIFPKSEKDTKRFHMTIIGLLPEETYHFVPDHGKWTLEKIN